jgi:hypothetical protein
LHFVKEKSPQKPLNFGGISALSKEKPLEMSEFLRFGKISFLNKISKDAIHFPQSVKQKSTHLAKKSFTVKSPKKALFSKIQ